MRTTLDLDDHLLEAARQRAASQRRTLTAFVEEAIAAALAPRPANIAPFRLHLDVDHGRCVAGVDLADRDALVDVMEGRR